MLTHSILKATWKNLADTKSITARDVIQHCILRAIIAKSEDKVEIAKHLLRKAFTPITHPVKLANGREPFDIVTQWGNGAALQNKKWVDGKAVVDYDSIFNRILGQKADVYLSPDQLDLYYKIYDEVKYPSKLQRKYSYFFTRQDLFKEYQLVQTAHVALELGAQIGAEEAKGLYFTVCGVEDLDALEEVERILQTMKLKYVVFREPDIGNTKTSIGVYPVAEHKRGILRSFSLLKFRNESW